MKYKVLKKQKNSRKCMVCGLKNDFGLKARFYELDNDELVAIFQPLQVHQGYPERLHGGIAAAVLDETIGRAILIKNENLFGVSVELNLKFRKPVPLDEYLKVIGRITEDSSRLFTGTGEIILKNGEVAVTASGRYLKMATDKMPEFDSQAEEWKVSSLVDDPLTIEI